MSANYIMLTTLALDARQQYLDSMLRIGEILRNGSSGAGLFPSNMPLGVIRAALEVLDLVENASFLQDERAQRLLCAEMSRDLYPSILQYHEDRADLYLGRPDSPMHTSPPRESTTLENVQSPTVTPPAKRPRPAPPEVALIASSSRLPPPPAMESRTRSLGEASTSSARSSRGQTSSAGKSSTRDKGEKKRKREASKK